MIKQKETYIFKVSSSKIIGSGHIYRCLKIANKIQKHKVLFLTNKFKNNFNHLIEKFKIHILANNEKNFSLKTDLIDTINVIQKINGRKILIIDNYINDLDWQIKISKFVDKIVIINDDIKNNYCDLYINYNYFISKINNKFFKKKKCKKLIGPKFFLINQKIYKKRKNPKKIFMFFGGHDNKMLSIKIIKLLKNIKDIRIKLVTNDAKIKDIIKKLNFKKIELINQKMKFYKLLNDCKFGIVSGGSIIFDLIYNKVPFICIPVAKNQINNLVNLKKKNYINLYKKKINNRFTKYFIRCNNKKCKKLKLIDGDGLARVVKEIKKV